MQAYGEPFYRRICDRFKVEASATLLAEGEREQPCVLKNISARGGGIVGNFALKEDERVSIVIHPFMFGKPMRRNARVAWCRRINDRLWEGGLDFGMDRIEFS